jgi:serine/threonine protein kinase/tetratricopeptide (TPR) repeat protein
VTPKTSDCPDENTLTAFAERLLSPDAHAAVEAHLDGCSDCLQIVSHMARGMAARDTHAHSPESAPTQDESVDEAPSEGPRLPDDVLLAGESVGRYTVVQILGQGGMGTVYRAHDPQLDRWVALKVLRFDRAAPEPRARMTREARLMAKLDHPNIVTVFDAGEADGRTYIAMELVVGTTLTVWLRSAERKVSEVLPMFLVAGRALAAAHRTGVVHRDFKPENVLIDERGRLAVTDFGIAVSSDVAVALSRRLAPPSSPLETGTAAVAVKGATEAAGEGEVPSLAISVVGASFTRTGMVLGTPGYMSPEQYEGQRVEAASDQFSFAVALYEALLRESPFAGRTFEERRDAVLDGQLLPLSEAARARVSPGLYRTLVRALARDPAARFPSMLALIAELEAHGAAPARSPRRRLVLAGLLALAGGALVMGLVGLDRARKPVTVTDDVSVPALATAPAALSTVRAAVVSFPFENRTSDPRLDGVLDPVLTALLVSSRHLDGYNSRSFRAAHRDLLIVEPHAETDAGSEEADLGRLLRTKENRAVIGVHGEVTTAGPAGNELAVSIVARDLGSGKIVAELRDVAPSASDLVPLMRRIAWRLRAALGDVDLDAGAGDGGASDDTSVLSASPEALHEWARGQVENNEGMYAEAKEHLTHAVALDPDFAEAHADLAITDGNLLMESESLRENQLALKHSDRMAERARLLVMANYYAVAGQPSEAIGAYEQILSIWPGDLRTEVNVAATALDASQFVLGLELARRAVADHPYSSVGQANLLLALVANGRFAEAARTGDSLLEGRINLPSAGFCFIALAHYLTGERDRALEVYAKLTPLDASWADEGRTDLAIYEGRLDDAEAVVRPSLTRALARGGPNAGEDQYQGLSIALSRRGDLAGAARAARPIIGDDSSVQFQYGMAKVMVEGGAEREVAPLAARWAERKAASARAFGKLLLGDIALHHGKTAEAIDAYQAALALDDNWRGHERLGAAHLAAKQWTLAEADFRTCLERRGEAVVIGTPSLQFLVPAEFGLARALDGAGDPSAVAQYQSFLARRSGAQGDRMVQEAERRLAALTSAASATRR